MNRHAQSDPGLELLRQRRGQLSRIAEAIGISRNGVSKWRKVPRWHLLAVEEVTGIPREDLRPDLFPPAIEPQRFRDTLARLEAKGGPITMEAVQAAMRAQPIEPRLLREAIDLLEAQGKPVTIEALRDLAER